MVFPQGGTGCPPFFLRISIRMIFQRYFKTGQKVQLRVKNQPPLDGRAELLGAILDSGDEEHFVLQLPYGPNTVQDYPLPPGLDLELSADAMGLGVKVSVVIQDALAGDRIRVRVHNDLQMFQRRAEPRIDCNLAIHITRGRNALGGLRQTWEKQTALLAESHGVQSLEGFHSREVNLSSGGIRLKVPPPAEPADVYLLQIALADRKPPLCALAEIIWVSEQPQDQLFYAGMRFINILDQDQKRIASFIRESS